MTQSHDKTFFLNFSKLFSNKKILENEKVKVLSKGATRLG